MRKRREGSQQDLAGSLSSSLGKLGATDTIQKGIDEIKDYLHMHKLSEEKMNHFLSSLTPNNEHMLSINHKREFIKLYGVFAEILEGEAIQYLGKIFAALSKKLKECNTALNESISLAYGQVIHNTLHTLPDLESSCSQMLAILKVLFENMNSTNKIIQVGSGLCITKIIQHSPLECLTFLLDRLSGKLVQVLGTCKAHCQIVEAIISLVLSVEQKYELYAARTVPELMNHAFEEDYLCRKQVAEALYTLAAVVPAAVQPLADEVLNVLNKLRTDKARPVRESAVEAMNLYKRMASEPSPFKVNAKSPTELAKPKSIFRGPVNSNFFKAANNDLVFEAPEKNQNLASRDFDDDREEVAAGSPGSISPAFGEDQIFDKFEFELMPEETVERTEVRLERNVKGEKKETEVKVEMKMKEKEKNKEMEMRVTKDVKDINDFKGLGGNKDNKGVKELKINKIEGARDSCYELKCEFGVFKEHVRGELGQINQRLTALEELISTVSQLFDAKLKQITCNPNIASLLRK